MRIVNNILDKAANANGLVHTDDNFQIMRYGFISFLLVFVKSVILFFIAYWFGVLPQMLYYALILCIIKQHSLGIHFNPIVCAVMCVVYFFGGMYLAYTIPFHEKAASIIFLIGFVCNAIYAPSQTKNRTISSPVVIEKEKIKTLFYIFLVYCMIDFLPNDILKNLHVMAVIVETFTILPITYKVFNEERPVNQRMEETA